MKKVKTSKKYTLINKKQEVLFLNSWTSQSPNSILFIHGLKGSGKTTLLNKMVNEQWSVTNNFAVIQLDLKKKNITDYKTFLQSFFDIESSKYKKTFIVKEEVLKRMNEKKLDPFRVIIVELEKLNKKGIRPLIIIDELQALAKFYTEKQKIFFKELFDLFVSITKESHLAHVIIASSDGHFIKKIFDDCKLKKSASLREVDYF